MFVFSRSHNISTTCILPVGNTPYRILDNTRKNVARLCSLSYREAYIHGNLFLSTDQSIQRFLQPEKCLRDGSYK